MKLKKGLFLIYGLVVLSVSHCDINISVSGDLLNARFREANTPPAIPTGVAVVVSANRELTISWNASANATGYYVYYGTAAGLNKNSSLRYTQQTATTKVVGSLPNGTPYYFAVSAVKGSAESELSAEVTATPILVPGTPAISSLTQTNSGELTLTWTAVPDANSYTVYYATAPGVTKLNSTIVPNGTATSLVLTGLANNTTYYFRVTSTVQHPDLTLSEGSLSPESSATSYLIPGTPAAPTVAQGASGTLGISWGATANAVSYKIYWSTAPGVTTANTFLTSTTPSINHSGLTNGATYYYRVAAVSGPYETALSAESFSAVYSATAVPAGVSVTQTASGQLTITWNAAANATGYNVYWANASPVTLAGSVAASGGTTFVHTGLTSGSTYYYKITAVNPAFESALSAEVNSLVYATPATPAIVSVTPTASGQLTISWGAATGATSYELYYGTAPGVTTASAMVSVAGTSYVHNGLATGSVYYYAVRAINPGFNSVLSGEMSQTVFTTPSMPTGLTSSSTVSAEILVSWLAAANADSYKLYWTSGATPVDATSSVITVPGGAATSYNHMGLANATQYNYRITAYNSACAAAGCPPALAESTMTLTHQNTAYVTPAVPTIASVTATGSNQLTVTWGAVPNAVAYRLWYSTPNGGTGTVLLNSNATSYVHAGLANATTYFYAVTAYSGPAVGTIMQESAKSAEVSAVAYCTPVAPSMSFVVPSIGTNVVAWTPGAGCGGASINLYWANVNGVTTASNLVAGATSYYYHTGLVNGSPYFYRATAVNGPFVSALSAAEVSGIPVTPGLPVFNENFDAAPVWPHQGWLDTGALNYTLKAVSAGTGIGGSNSFMMVSNILGSHGAGITKDFSLAPLNPSYIAYSVNCAGNGVAEAYTTLQDTGGLYVFFSYCAALVYINSSSFAPNVTFGLNTWHRIELLNIDWVGKKYDYFVDGLLIKQRASMRDPLGANLAKFNLYNYQPGTAHYDDIMIW